MYLFIIFAEFIYSCKVVISGYTNFPEGSNVTCYGGQDKNSDFMNIDSDPHEGDFNIHNPIKCYFNNQNCKDDINVGGLYQNSCPQYGKYVDIDISSIPNKCFVNGYMVDIRNTIPYPGYEIYVLDKYNNTTYQVHYDELFYIEHDVEFTVDVYFKADLCDINMLVETLSASKGAETKYYTDSLADQYCKPVKFTIVNDLPNDYQLYYNSESNSEFYQIYSDIQFKTGIQNHYNFYVRLLFDDVCNDLTKIETTFIGTSDGVTYHITEDDVPQQCLKYSLQIYNNVQKEGYTLYGLINGIGDYFQIENGDNKYEGSTRFYIEIYMKWGECQEYAYTKTLSSFFGHGDVIYIEEKDIPTECSNKIYNLNITNNILIPGYEIYVKDNLINYNVVVQSNEMITIFHREPFIANVSIKMDSCNPSYQIDSINVSSDPMSKVFNIENIPNECSPFRICFNNKIPDSYSLYYKFDTESSQEYQILTNDPIISGNNFNLSLYVTFEEGCDKQKLDKNFQSSKQTTCVDLSLDDIPQECLIYFVILENLVQKSDVKVFALIKGSTEYTEIKSNTLYSHAYNDEFDVEIYMKWDGCDKYTYSKTVSSSLTNEKQKIEDSDIPSSCNEFNKVYQCIFDFRQISNDYSFEYQLFNYETEEFGPAQKVSGLLNITQNKIFGIRITMVSSPGCTNYILGEFDITDVYPVQTITEDDIPAKCKVNGGTGSDDIVPDNQYHEIEITDTSIDNIKEQLEEAFNDEKNWDSNSNDDKVISIVNQNAPLNFNMDLGDNQYISLPDGGTINYEGGNLKLVLSDNEETEVQLSSQDAKVSVKGGGKLALISENKHATINSVLTLTKDFNLAAKGSLETLNIDTINLYENSNLNIDPSSSAKINVNKIEVKPLVETTLENINIRDTLIITQTATVSLDSSIIKDANLIFNIKSNSDIMPMLDGRLLETPKSFSITNDGGEPKKNQQITLISSTSDLFDCGKWRDLLSLSGSGYNTKECIDVEDDNEDNAKKLEENEAYKALVIRNNKKDKGGTKPGVIAAIVIAVIVVVAVVIIVVIVVIRKKKNQNNSESEDQAKEDNI